MTSTILIATPGEVTPLAHALALAVGARVEAGFINSGADVSLEINSSISGLEARVFARVIDAQSKEVVRSLVIERTCSTGWRDIVSDVAEEITIFISA